MIHARIWNIYHMRHIWCIYYIYYMYYIYYIYDTKNWLHFFFYNAKLIVSLMVFCRSAIVPRKHSYGKSTDDKQVIRQSPADQIDKSGQTLAPCGRQAFKWNVINKTTINAKDKNKQYWRLLDLSRAGAVLAYSLYYFDISLDDTAENDRKHIFLYVAYYALIDGFLK